MEGLFLVVLVSCWSFVCLCSNEDGGGGGGMVLLCKGLLFYCFRSAIVRFMLCAMVVVELVG